VRGLVAPAVAALGVVLVVLALRGIARHGRSRPELVLGVLVLLVTGVAADTRLGIGTTPRIAVSLAGVALGSLGFLRPGRGSRLGTARAPGCRPEPLATGQAISIAALVLATVWGFAIDTLLADASGATQVFGRLIPLVSWVFCALAVQSRLLDPEDVLRLVVAVFGLAAIGAVALGNPWSDCSVFKCGPFGALFDGPFASENGFARIACLAALASLRHRDPRIAVLGSGTAALVLYASGSRTSQIALVAALVAWSLCRPLPRGPRRLSLLSVVAAAVVAGTYLVSTAGPTDFSNRGSIWMLGRQAVGDRWWLGRGLDNWSVHVLARNYMHSELLLLVFSGGVLLVALYATHLGGIAVASADAESGYAAGLVTLVCIAGLTEIAWNPIALDGTTVAIVMLLFVPGLGDRRRRRVPAPASAVRPGPA
jgi:hypothetical protein